MQNLIQRHPLFIIVLAQLCGTSLWFSINGAGLALIQDIGLSESDLGWLTLTVQVGFITGTLIIATTGLADKLPANHIFAISCLVGAMANASFVLVAAYQPYALILRFLTGLCLAGIYPLGMKLVIGWIPNYVGSALAWLVGMLTMGTALPHLLRGATLGFPWEWTILSASGLALLGGTAIFILGDGPHLPPSSGKAKLRDGFAAIRERRLRAVAFGYFGHSWELYALWTLIPFMVTREIMRLDAQSYSVPLMSFAIVALGLLGCIGGGALSRRIGSLAVARLALASSGLICLIYPLVAFWPPEVMLLLLAIWGVTVIADSPQLSALIAETAPKERVGSILAIINSIGFALTIPSIALTTTLWHSQGVWVAWWLLPGPVLGLWAMHKLRRQE